MFCPKTSCSDSQELTHPSVASECTRWLREKNHIVYLSTLGEDGPSRSPGLSGDDMTPYPSLLLPQDEGVLGYLTTSYLK
jgi:hypothetical protein